jgi:hypothetical protein
MSSPSAFCSISTNLVKTDLIGMLFSLSIQHPRVPLYLFVDKETSSFIDTMRPCLNLTLHIEVNMEEWNSPRSELEKTGRWQTLMLQKMDAMDLALASHDDVCYIDTDVLLLEPILVDKTKDIGVSAHRILESNHRNFGLYNGGILWTRNGSVPQRWKTLGLTKSRYFEQACIETLVEEFSHFVFGEEYNLGWWKVEESPEPPKKMLEYFQPGSGALRGKPLFKGKPIVFVHTHFSSKDKIVYNSFLFNLFMACHRYRECCLIHRMLFGKWIINLPKQPMQGVWQHNDDSFRELVRIWERIVPDLEVRHSATHDNCFLHPNICMYDRPTLDWANTERVRKAHLVLLGNPSVHEPLGELSSVNCGPWIFWARHPMVLEDFIQKVPLKGYADRICESVFLGNVENRVQANHRVSSGNWKPFVERFELLAGNEHRYSQREYLQILANSRFGLSLRGFGGKCNRDIELMALGTVPIMGPLCDTESYDEPLVEGIHFLRANRPEDIPKLLLSVDAERWVSMSDACKDWYTRNAHSSNAWAVTLRTVMYGSPRGPPLSI